jgi:hypothetical protein
MLRFGLLVPGLAIAACLVLGCDDGENRKDAPAAVPGERGAEVSAAARSVTRKWRAFKTLVVLEASDATLRVARGDRSSLLLGYDPVEFRGTGLARSRSPALMARRQFASRIARTRGATSSSPGLSLPAGRAATASRRSIGAGRSWRRVSSTSQGEREAVLADAAYAALDDPTLLFSWNSWVGLPVPKRRWGTPVHPRGSLCFNSRSSCRR